ncbi:MAG TPA: glutathione S-transferase family protein [Pseudomonadales bacterium]|nr:glutathione S-transferase family protein [Pseudomonadales bacterium]
MDEALTLYEFRFSHYNEKARWALDYKGIGHRRVALLPGPHMRFLKRHTGQTQTPALRDGERWICGSAAIVEWAEAQQPSRPLFPMDAGERAAALEWIRWLDKTVGWWVRVLGLGAMLQDAAYVTRVFAGDRSPLVQLLYRSAFPLARGMIARGNGLNAQASERAEQEVAQALERIGARLDAHPWLAGDHFTAADLTAASLLAPLCDPEWPTMHRPEPRPPQLQALLARYAREPVCDWVRETYRTHRAAPGA